MKLVIWSNHNQGGSKVNNIWIYVLALLFGIIIVIMPAIVAYLIALYLIVFGIAGIIRFLRKT